MRNGGPGGSDPANERVLADGARRSLEAQRPAPQGVSAGAPDRATAVLEPTAESRVATLWRRHKWKLAGLLILIITEIVLFTVGSTSRGP